MVLGHTTEHGYTNSYANNTTVEYPRFTTYVHVIDIVKTNCIQNNWKWTPACLGHWNFLFPHHPLIYELTTKTTGLLLKKYVMHVQIHVLQAFRIWKEDLQSFYFNTYSMLIIIMLWDLLFCSWEFIPLGFWGSGVSSNCKLLLFLPTLCTLEKYILGGSWMNFAFRRISIYRKLQQLRQPSKGNTCNCKQMIE